jgi:hypothetical protein
MSIIKIGHDEARGGISLGDEHFPLRTLHFSLFLKFWFFLICGFIYFIPRMTSFYCSDAMRCSMYRTTTFAYFPDKLTSLGFLDPCGAEANVAHTSSTHHGQPGTSASHTILAIRRPSSW